MKIALVFLIYLIILIALFIKFPILMLGIELVLVAIFIITTAFFNYTPKEGEFDDKYYSNN